MNVVVLVEVVICIVCWNVYLWYFSISVYIILVDDKDVFFECLNFCYFLVIVFLVVFLGLFLGVSFYYLMDVLNIF